MPAHAATHQPTPTELERLSHAQLLETVQALTSTVQTLQHQLEWFKRQLFGQKSERMRVLPDAQQLSLGDVISATPTVSEPPQRKVAAHTRRARQRDAVGEAESVPFFDEARVPIETIELPNLQVQGLDPAQFERIGQKISYRLAQRPGSYVVLKYVRPLMKRLDTQVLSCPPAPLGVLDGSRADVSFIAGLLVDKFGYHMPLYRIDQRLGDNGFRTSRPWLTQIAQQSIALLEPVYDAQLLSIRTSRVKAMDETPIKAGRTEHGKMRTAYFWPVYGEGDEVCFPFFPSRDGDQVRAVLGASHAADAVLLTDGYAAYQSYAQKVGLTHAQCWTHSRRNFFEAQSSEPDAVHDALKQIGALYAIEEEIRERKLAGESKRLHRLTHSKPRVDAFFDWVRRQFEQHGLKPGTPFTQALGYVRDRRLALEVFLTDPDVPMDTNHLERALRAIPMGRKNWNFCWTELGAKHVGIVQSLIVTCRLHGLDPYDYLVDVLQRVGQHPAARVAELTPRQWKDHFADNPLRSDLYRIDR